MPGCCRAWWDSVSPARFFHYSCPPTALSQFPSFSPLNPFIRPFALVACSGFIRWYYRAGPSHILMDQMQRGERWELGEEEWEEFMERRRRSRQARSKRKQGEWEMTGGKSVFLKIHFLHTLQQDGGDDAVCFVVTWNLPSPFPLRLDSSFKPSLHLCFGLFAVYIKWPGLAHIDLSRGEEWRLGSNDDQVRKNLDARFCPAQIISLC